MSGVQKEFFNTELGKDRVVLLHNGIRQGKIEIPELHDIIPGTFRKHEGIRIKLKGIGYGISAISQELREREELTGSPAPGYREQYRDEPRLRAQAAAQGKPALTCVGGVFAGADFPIQTGEKILIGSDPASCRRELSGHPGWLYRLHRRRKKRPEVSSGIGKWKLDLPLTPRFDCATLHLAYESILRGRAKFPTGGIVRDPPMGG